MVSTPNQGTVQASGGLPESNDVETVVFSVHAAPGASRSRILGVEAGVLKVRVAAPPVKGKANKELVKLLAQALGVSRAQVEITSGHKARRKRVRVRGVRREALGILMPSDDRRQTIKE